MLFESQAWNTMTNSQTDNPLLKDNRLPPFNAIVAEHIQPAIEQLLNEGRDKVSALTADLGSSKINWNSLVEPLDDIDDLIDKAWSPIGHMNAVVSNDAWRDAHNACLPLLSQYSTEVKQNAELYTAYCKLADSDDYASLSIAQQKTIDNTLRDFRLAGIALDEEKKQRYGEIRRELSTLSSEFSDNVLDATQMWSKYFDSSQPLQGLPESALAAMAEAAQQEQRQGYLVSLEFPSYLAVMTYCDDRKLREEIYWAYQTRASDQGPFAGQHDNTGIISRTLKLRQELAALLGFNNYAEYSLATKMADSPEQVIDFLEELATKSLSAAKKDFEELQNFCREQYQADNIQPWDITYYSEKMRQLLYAVSQEELRAYFPLDTVLQGLFEISGRLFQIEIKAEMSEQLWHPDARFYRVERQGEVLAYFYLDLYARSKKRGGAWMDDCRCRRRLGNGELQLPVAYLSCNFNGPVGDDPALLTHSEVTTLFHEFGHGLHHMLTKVETLSVSGINGVPWDAVELPSQFMENWCWQSQGLALISAHYKTGEALPQALLDRLLVAKNFQSGMQMVRQLEFALFDLAIHRDTSITKPEQVQEVLDQVRQEISVIPTVDYNRFQNSFGHIFAGGYAAGYYSYKWAEVLSADAFSRFEEEGIFNTRTGEDFLHDILEKGGSEEPRVLFKNFRGREPSTDALLKHSGLIAPKDNP